MHLKYLALFALASGALAQDWLDDAMDALESTTDLPNATNVPDDVPTLEEFMEDNPTDIETTNDFGGSSDDSLSSSSSSSMSSSSSNSVDEEEDDSDSLGTLGGVPSDIVSQVISAVPPSVISEIMNPTSLSSLQSEVAEGKFPAWATDLPPDVKDYLETAWDVEVPKVTDAPSSGGDDNDSDSDSGNSNDDDDEDAAGMVSPSVFASVLGAVGVLAVALAL
ncbi:uncharacterized protein BDV17DRAFT_235142 [Aspergillus undulatus]|uniref:uncharacterized protein n=1 Tax=Aspergillus undulatus TaxID=1810928 RepID=UPI003CCDC66E